MRSPLLQPISFAESSRVSPWPGRILGFEVWHKPERTAAEVLLEYEAGYRRLDEEWTAYASGRKSLSEIDALRFMRGQIRRQCRSLVSDPIYRSSVDEYLVSSGDNLFAMNLELATSLSQNALVNYLHDVQSEIGFSQVVETGCGSGFNLFLLYAHLPLTNCLGGDLCPSAVSFVERVFRECRMQGRFQPYDYLDPQSLRLLLKDARDYVLVTCHSIEQVQIAGSGFLETIASLPNPPRRIIHFEPIVDEADDSLLGRCRRKYAQINRYNGDLLRSVRACEEQGLLRVVDYQRCLFGVSAFNPTSVLQWEVRS